MKSNTQQVVSIILVVCLFVFFGVGIASDGFTDFEVFEPKPIAPSIATAEVEDCSSEVAQSDTIDRIMWENERVEFEFTLVSGDINADAGFSISDEGIFSVTNEEFYKEAIANERYGDVYIRFFGCNGASNILLSDISNLKSFDIVRGICKGRYYANKFFSKEPDIATIEIYISRDFLSGGFIDMSDVVYSVSINFLDRVSSKDERFLTPTVEEGYVFDGWYSDPSFIEGSYIGSKLPVQTDDGKLFYYLDAMPVARIAPAVNVNFVAGGSIIKTLSCASGTTLPTINSLSAENFMGIINYLQDNVFYSTDEGFIFRKGFTRPYVIDSDLTLTYGIDKTFVTVLFYNGDDLFYHCDVELNDYLNIENIPVPLKPGYDFVCWQNVSDESSFSGGIITENTSFSANFDLHYYTVTLNFPEGYATESGRTSFSETGVSHLTNSYYHFPYGDVFELKGSDGLLYKTDGWITEDGADYDFCSPIYADLNLYAKVVRLRYKVSYWYKDIQSAYAFKIVEYYPGDLVDYERDLAEYQRLGYVITIYVSGAGATAGNYYEYDYSPVTSTTALYIHYSACEYTVRFHSESYLSFDSSICTCEDKLSLPFLLPITGYDFLGWYYQDGSPFDENAVVLSDLDLYAKWQIQRKTVTLMSAGEVQSTFEVDYGTSLDDVLKQINYQNYNVISFSADGFTDENCFVADVSFEVAQMDKQDSVINTLKNKWKIVVGIVAGVLLLVIILSVVPKSMKKYVRKRK